MNLVDIKERAFILSPIHFFTSFFFPHPLLYLNVGKFFFFFQPFIMCIFLFPISIIDLSVTESGFDFKRGQNLYTLCIL